MFERTLSIYSAGQILQATGIKCGWIIGPEYLVTYPAAIFQVTCFSQYNVLENAVAKSLDYIGGPSSEFMLKLA
jgi:aspartate/methionine/tyrosine aminotransferase